MPPTLLPTTTAALLSWGLQSTLLLGAGWLLYRYALRQERFFDFNRRFLLLLPWVALLVPPLLAATEPGRWLSGWLPVPAPDSLHLLSGGVLPAITVREPSGGPLVGPLPWLLGLYGAGVALLLLRLAGQLLHLHRSTRHFAREVRPDCVLVCTGGQRPVSSFGRLIFWDETAPLTPAEARAVLAHELAHVRGRHTHERLLLEVARALLWPVPFVHLLPPALAQLHEFLADAAAVQAAADTPAAGHFTATPAAYPALLARLALAQFRPDLPLAHSFNSSFTLTRIRMLTTSAPLRRWKRWLPLPVATLALALATSFSALAQATTQPAPPAPPAVYTFVDQMPQYAGGQVQLLTDIGQLVKYPAAATEAKLEGRVMIKFIITAAGKIEAAEVSKGVAATPAQARAARLLNEVALNAVRSLPGKWTPGRQNGVPVAVQYNVPISFALN
ncbi:TonB family protein [Hymenobacter sp. ISL-91]|uniref:TonB family protein n=1 Tax=Hymenobacter sp. ISL-91 TaxID=2819151 RepID=UPI001BE9D4D9|nr:M56 family metallopeptidase [Hymenobacter sp. ISL-91]MBT2556440.1 TonB family protein [Hymenobacter sp. ISL-91]